MDVNHIVEASLNKKIINKQWMHTKGVIRMCGKFAAWIVLPINEFGGLIVLTILVLNYKIL